MANITQTTVADGVKTQYERRLLVRAVPRLVHGRWGIPARLNKYGSLEWRKYGALSAITAALTEGTTPSEQATPSLTLVTATPLFYGAWIGYTDEIDMTVFDPLVSEVSGILGEQAGLSVDTLIRNTLTAGATKDYSGNQTARNALQTPAHDVTYADFVKQVAALEAANAMTVDGDSYICIMHSYTWASLMLDPTFVNLFIEGEGGKALRDGFVGRVMRCNIYVTSNGRSYADGGANSTEDVYSMLFIAGESYGVTGMAGIAPKMVDTAGVSGKNLTGAGKRASPVELIMKGLGSAGADDPLNQRGTIAWKTGFDTDLLNAAWCRDLEHVNVFSAD